MPTDDFNKPAGHEPEPDSKARAIAFGRAIRELREERGFSRAELLDRFYTQLTQMGIQYKVRGDWWLNGIENGEKAKPLPREYIDAFIRALECTKLETVRVLLLADLNILPVSTDTSHVAGLTYVLSEVFTTALKTLEARLNTATAARLDEREWLEIGKAVLAVVAADLEERHGQ